MLKRLGDTAGSILPLVESRSVCYVYLALSSSPHSFPPFLLEDVELPALLQLQDCICHRGPVGGV